ncbi:Twinfilin-1, partial [Spiromyces aspiralis]
MSLQSGITVSEELRARFSDAVSTRSTRIFKASIAGETIVHTSSHPVRGTFEEDFGKVIELLEDREPCYLLVLLDNAELDAAAGADRSGSRWISCAYVPEDAPVRKKMLYASTYASLCRELGESFFADSLYGTTKSEFTLDGYRQHRESVEADAPLTQQEQERQLIKEQE